MATYTFLANPLFDQVNWASPAVWEGDVVPDSPDANVVIPPAYFLQGGTYSSFITIDPGASFTADAVSLTDNVLELDGSLSVTGGFTLGPGSDLDLNGGTLTTATLQSQGGADIQGSGTIVSPGSFDNAGLIGGGGQWLLSFGQFDNTGTLFTENDLNLDVTDNINGFRNLFGTTLTGGTYIANEGGTLFLNVGGTIVTDDADIALQNQYGAAWIETYDTFTGQTVPLQDSLQTIGPTGTLSLAASYVTANTLTLDGALNLSSGSTFDAGGLMVGATAGTGLRRIGFGNTANCRRRDAGAWRRG